MEEVKPTYYQQHADQIKEKYNVSLLCAECNTHVQRWNLSKHRKSRVHKQNEMIKNLQNNIN